MQVWNCNHLYHPGLCLSLNPRILHCVALGITQPTPVDSSLHHAVCMERYHLLKEMRRAIDMLPIDLVKGILFTFLVQSFQVEHRSSEEKKLLSYSARYCCFNLSYEYGICMRIQTL